MLDTLSYEEFAGLVGTKFQVANAASPIEIEFTEITERRATEQQESFSLMFRGPKEVVLPQGIYPLQNDETGSGEFFLVPVAMTDEGVQYEAVFNRLLV